MRLRTVAITGAFACLAALGCPALPGGPDIPLATDAFDAADPVGPDLVVLDVHKPDPGSKDHVQPVDPGQPDPGSTNDGCVPDCWIHVCGADGCGGTCGTCPDGTVCSNDHTLCVATAIQKPLGGPCGESEECSEFRQDPIRPGARYYNSAWPACLEDQCRDGPCLEGFCSRACTVTKDTLTNGTTAALPDGIEDADAPASDCTGGLTTLFADGFLCVATTPATPGQTDPAPGVCYPKASFKPCSAVGDCPDGESCGFIVVRGSIETHCLAAPVGGAKMAEPCGFDKTLGKTVPCLSWACSADGCTSPCVEAPDCLTAGASCDVASGTCVGTGLACAADSDCSAWQCVAGVTLPDPAGAATACAPKMCDTDAACGDPQTYCRYRLKTSDLASGPEGRCMSRTAGGAALGDACDDTPGDGNPDVVCADRAYCVDHRCGAACVSDDACAAGGSMKCGVHAFPVDVDHDGVVDGAFDAGVCIHLGVPGTACEAQSDCASGTCTPWMPLTAAVPELDCAEAPAGGLPIGNPCGAAAFGQECAARRCIGERASDNVAGVCSQPCRTRDDCPAESAVGAELKKWLCETALFDGAGTTWRPDDRYVAWCVPVPAASSLDPCDPSTLCSDPGEACLASVRFGAPGDTTAVAHYCERPAVQVGVGAICDPARNGTDCGTAACSATAIDGVGFCTRPCATDLDCGELSAWGAVCDARVVVPRSPAETSVSVNECRVRDACVVCRDDWDCGTGFRCVDVSPMSAIHTYRCAPGCATDGDCTGIGASCTVVGSPPASAQDGSTKACLPITCPN